MESNITRTIFFGDVSSDLADFAQQHDRDAVLLHKKNYQNFFASKKSGWTAYTSLGDLPKDLSTVYDILTRADCIRYHPPITRWSDGLDLDLMDPCASMHGLSETMLRLLPESIRIYGLPNDWSHDPIPLVDQRKTPGKQLWIAGCSISHGYAIDPEQRFGVLLAKDLQLECSFLTRSGSALDWAADQILRSDILPDDIVIWGITAWCRMTRIHQHHLLKGVTVRSFDHWPEYHKILHIEDLFSQDTFYNGIYAIQKAMNFCEKIGAKLFLVGFMHGNFALLKFLQSQKNYIHIPYQLEYQDGELVEKYIDLGTDQIHPGPKQHQSYKNTIITQLI